ncbi:MAG: WG repeat-containing protein, partial [Clostridia bacterium]|nr:WG repeat-containing protein [Clostridia bacterium]
YVRAAYAEPLYPDLGSIGHYYFDEGLVRVRMLERDYSYTHYITADEDWLIDKNDKRFEIPAGYTLAGYADGVLLLEREGRYGYYHTDGYWIAQPIYTYAQPFMEGVGVIGFASGKVGAVDTRGNIHIPFTYDYISAPSTGVIAAFAQDGGWTVFAKCAK